MMGSPCTEAGRDEDETQHVVTLTHDFVILSTEVTQAEFERLMGYNPSYFSDGGDGATCGDDCPVETVSWHEAAAYCSALSDEEGFAPCYSCSGVPPNVECEPADFATPYDCPGYRLPTEAEWEYAARAGTTTATYRGNLDPEHLECESPNPVLDPMGWFCGNSDGSTHEIGTLEPNDWGLYDMSGNAMEWCHDWSDSYPGGAVTDPWGPGAGSFRVFRGGSWADDARYTRAAVRYRFTPGARYRHIVFRPSRSQ